MKNKFLSFIFILTVVAVIISSVALAAWWNPLSWNWNIFSWFSKPQSVVPAKPVQQTEQPSQAQNPQQNTNVGQTLSEQEIDNLTYSGAAVYGPANGILTFKNGWNQSEKIDCTGVHGTCPNGDYAFAKIDKVVFNSTKTSAAVVIIGGYALSLNDFESNMQKYGTQSVKVYEVSKDSNGKISITNPYDMGGGFQIDKNVHSLIITQVAMSDDGSIRLTGTAQQNDGHGNFTNIKPEFDFIFKNNSLILTSNPTTAKPINSITIISPNGGEVWKIGETHNITWTSQNIDKVNIWLAYTKNGISNSIPVAKDVSASSGQYAWAINNFGVDLTGALLKIEVVSTTSSGVTGSDFDTSDNYFSISQ